MRILIAGGFGFVGGRVAQFLHQVGHQIVLGSRNTSSSPNWLTQVDVVQTKWNDDRALEKICKGVDVVIQSAGMNAQDCEADPIAALEINGLATARLVQAASRVGAKRFIYISTSHVYSNQLVGSFCEETCPRNIHPYAASHLVGENAVLNASQRGHLEGIVLRLSNAIGAPVNKNVNCWMLLVNDLCRQAVESKQMALRTSGLQQRDFISMHEVCRLIEHLSCCEWNLEMASIFNVGSGKSQSIFEMMQLIQNRCKLVLGFEPNLYRPQSDTDYKHGKLEYKINKLEKLGWFVNDDNKDEIDGLLRYCNEIFNE